MSEISSLAVDGCWRTLILIIQHNISQFEVKFGTPQLIMAMTYDSHDASSRTCPFWQLTISSSLNVAICHVSYSLRLPCWDNNCRDYFLSRIISKSKVADISTSISFHFLIDAKQFGWVVFVWLRFVCINGCAYEFYLFYVKKVALET